MQAGLSGGDVALGEINEAFASVSVAATRALGLDEDIVNVLGSGCSLGHPVAMTGPGWCSRSSTSCAAAAAVWA